MQPLFSYSYSVPYLLLSLSLLFLSLNELGKLHVIDKKNSRYIAFILMLFFIGFRGHIKTDFINYYPYFNNLPIITDLKIADFEHYDPGFVIYTSLVKTVFSDYFIWVFINTLFDLLVLYYISRLYCLSTVLLYLVLLAYWGLGIEINLFRNSKAIMLFLVSLPYLWRRSIVPYMALNLLGCSFHISSIVYLPLYFVLTKEIPKVWVWGLFVFSNVVFFLGVSLSSQLQNLTVFVDGILGSDKLSTKATIWQESKNYGSEYGFSLGYFERLFFFLLLTFQYKKMVLQRSTNIMFYNSFVVFYGLFHILSPISTEIMKRLSMLFAFSYWFLLPNLLCLSRLKKSLSIAIILLCLMKVTVDNSSLMAKYHNVILSGKDNYARKKLIAFKVMSAMNK